MSTSSRSFPEPSLRAKSGVYGSPRQELPESAACLRLLEALPVAVVLVTSSGELLLANRRAAALLARSPEELVGRRLAELGAPTTLEEGDKSHWRLALPTGEERVVGCRVGVVEWAEMADARGEFLVVFDESF